MMLVLAVRSDPDRVYQRALRYFTPAELSEAFAATRGVASPTQLRAFMKRDPRDLLGTFRALAPPRQPIVLQRWSLRRVGLAAGRPGHHHHRRDRRRPGAPPRREHRRVPPAVRHRARDDPGRPGGPVGGAGAVRFRAPVGLAGRRRRHRQRPLRVLAGFGPGRPPGRDRHPVRGLRRFRHPAGAVRPAGHAAIRRPAHRGAPGSPGCASIPSPAAAPATGSTSRPAPPRSSRPGSTAWWPSCPGPRW